MSKEKLYVGVKEVVAKAMTRGAYNHLRGWIVPGNENPADEGYLVEYIGGGTPNVSGFNGYISWSPKDVFEEAYRNVDALPFSTAVELMKKGGAVARAGWNGKGMFVFIVGKVQGAMQIGEDVKLNPNSDMLPFIAMSTAQGDIVPWLASQTDILSDDWRIVQFVTAK